MSDHDADPPLPLDDLVDPGNFVMLMTMIDETHTSRPITVAAVTGSRLSFLVDRTASWMQAVIAGRAAVHATMADVKESTFLAFNGRVSVVADRAEVERLWNPGASVFFDGKDDPNAVVLHFDVTDGEYWDAPSGRIGRALALLRGVVGSADSVGDHGAIET